MGVYYFLVSDEAKEMYALGGGYWHNSSPHPSKEEVMDLARDIAANYDAGRSEAHRFALELGRWVEKHNGKVRILSDADDAFEEVKDYTETGDAYSRHVMSREEIKQRVKQVADSLRDELGADSVDIVAVIDSTPLIENPDEYHLFEFVGISRYDREFSGYQMIRKKADEQTDQNSSY